MNSANLKTTPVHKDSDAVTARQLALSGVVDFISLEKSVDGSVRSLEGKGILSSISVVGLVTPMACSSSKGY